MERQIYDANDLQAFGFSRVRAYQIMNDSTLPTFRIGRRLFVRISDFENWLAAHQVGGCVE